MSRTRSARLPRSFITLWILFHLHSTHKLKEEICVDGFEQPPKSEQLLKKKSVYMVAMTGGPTSNA